MSFLGVISVIFQLKLANDEFYQFSTVLDQLEQHVSALNALGSKIQANTEAIARFEKLLVVYSDESSDVQLLNHVLYTLRAGKRPAD